MSKNKQIMISIRNWDVRPEYERPETSVSNFLNHHFSRLTLFEPLFTGNTTIDSDVSR